MSLFRRGRIWWCHFFVEGKRYRRSTKQTTESKARQFESVLMANIRERGSTPVLAKAPTLREFSTRFFQWVDNTHRLKSNTRRYYRYGWKRLKGTPLAGIAWMP